MKFKFFFIRIVYGFEGEIIEGDEKEIDKVIDIWIFVWVVNGCDLNWKLIVIELEL